MTSIRVPTIVPTAQASVEVPVIARNKAQFDELQRILDVPLQLEGSYRMELGMSGRNGRWTKVSYSTDDGFQDEPDKLSTVAEKMTTTPLRGHVEGMLCGVENGWHITVEVSMKQAREHSVYLKNYSISGPAFSVDAFFERMLAIHAALNCMHDPLPASMLSDAFKKRLGADYTEFPGLKATNDWAAYRGQGGAL